MWFRNLQLYRLPENWAVTDEDLRPALANWAFRPCASNEASRAGWIEPAGVADGRMAIAVGRHILIALQVQTRLLPGAVIAEAAAENARLIEEQQGYKPGRTQMKEIRKAVFEELLPKSFTRSRKIYAWIDPVGGWLGIDASSLGLAELVLDALRNTLGATDLTLPVALVKTKLAPVSAMTSWLAATEAPASFTLDQDCELRAVTDEKAAVRYVHHALDGKDVQDHLAAGKLPTRVALTFDDRISFILTEKLAIKRLAFLDVLKEQADRDAETHTMQTEADFALMSGELARLIPALIEALGGEEKEVV